MHYQKKIHIRFKVKLKDSLKVNGKKTYIMKAETERSLSGYAYLFLSTWVAITKYFMD